MGTRLTDSHLIARIRQKCTADHWYGAYLDNPEQLHVSDDDPRRVAFVYAPATQEQVQATEAALGVALPSLLKMLYTRLANGGFGPGAGLRGIIGGYGTPTPPFDEYSTDDTIVGYDAYYKSHARPVNLAVFDSHWSPTIEGDRPRLLLPFDQWPQGMLCLCDLGCVQEVCYHSASNRLFLNACTQERGEAFHVLSLMPCTLEQWLDAWLDEKDISLSR